MRMCHFYAAPLGLWALVAIRSPVGAHREPLNEEIEQLSQSIEIALYSGQRPFGTMFDDFVDRGTLQ